MKTKCFLMFMVLTLVLSACGTLNISIDGPAAAIPTPTPVVAARSTITALQAENQQLVSATATLFPDGQQPLSLESTSEQIQQFLLTSAGRWTTLWLDGTIKTQWDVAHQQVWLDPLGARFRFLSGPLEGRANRFKVSDGSVILEMNISTGESRLTSMPEGVAGQFIPQLIPDTANPNPLWRQIGEALPEMAVPSDRAQSQGVFKPIAIETMIGRRVLVVEWTYIRNSKPSWRAWVDLERGIFLKWQAFEKTGGDEVLSEFIVHQALFDIPDLNQGLFDVNPSAAPVFSDVSGDALTPTQAPAAPAGSDPLGDVYFFSLFPDTVNNFARYFRLPGSCVVGQQPCPEPEELALPAPTYLSMGFVDWASNRKTLAYSSSIGDGNSGLFISTLPGLDWKEVARIPFIDSPLWSPNGQWLTFNAHYGDGNYNIYVVRADGSGLKNITENLPTIYESYVVDGWIGVNLLLHPARPGQSGQLELYNVENGQVRALFETLITKSVFLPSPDGSLLAFDNYNHETSIHTVRVIAPDGSGIRDLATFKNTVTSITWSPDSSTLAFTVYGDDMGTTSTVYTIGRDGRDLTQVYTSSGIQNLHFSPDGNFLLVVDVNNKGPLMIINLSTLAVTRLESLGFRPSTRFAFITWVP